MQVTETLAEGLKRQLHVTLGANELAERRDKRIAEMKDRVQLKGFRKGKVPPAHLKKVFGRSLMAEVLQEVVEETTKQALTDRNERPAIQPKIEMPEDAAEIEKIMAGTADFSFKLDYEILPRIEIVDLAGLDLEKPVADVADDAVEAAILDLAKRNTTYESEDGRIAGDGDQVTIDFIGKIAGEPFEGGTAEDAPLVLGSGSFIPGFEEGLKGAKAGDSRSIDVTFPESYGAENLAGKPATFDVTVKDVAAAKVPAVDDEFAKGLGADSLDAVRTAIRGQIERQYEQASRARLKRALLDRLDAAHVFDLPPTLVDAEFEGIWKQMTQEMERAGRTFVDEGADAGADGGKTEADVRAEYRTLAERRVRLGLVIGEIGDQGKIQVSEDELRRALIEQARRFPGQEKFVYEFYQKTPGAIAELRAPIFEEKVVDYICEIAQPKPRKVSAEELIRADDDEDGAAA